MSSVKNAIVVVLLLGVSYGAFQVINAPDPTISDEVEALDIQIGPRIDDAGLADSPPPVQMDLPSRPNSPLAKGEAVPGDSVGPNERTMLPLKPDMAPPILENNSTSVSQFEPPATIKSNDPAALAKTAPLTMDSAASTPTRSASTCRRRNSRTTRHSWAAESTAEGRVSGAGLRVRARFFFRWMPQL